MKSVVREAYLSVHNRHSADRVVADPELNAAFIEECRSRGLSDPPSKLNKTLLNLRKAGLLKGLPRSIKTTFANVSDYKHAAEVAARFLEYRHNTTLDAIICDPTMAQEFDKLAADIAPGWSSLEYRWAALNLRKAKQLQPELLAHVVPAEQIDLGPLDGLDATALPTDQGIYIFNAPSETLYIGEATNLRTRLEKHIDHSDNKGLAHWLWANGIAEVFLEVRVLPSNTSTRTRKALEAELIKSRQPRFNVQRK